MQTDYLIVGQGICGTMLSWFLYREGKQFVVIDEVKENSSSRVAAGLINPVTGRRYSYSWMIEDIMPFAVQTYKNMEAYLEQTFIHSRSVIDFFPSPDARIAFTHRMAENDTYLYPFPDQNRFNQHFNYDFGCGEIRPAHNVDLTLLLDSWRKRLEQMGAIRNTSFEIKQLLTGRNEISYEDITAKAVIFCDGVAGTTNPWFDLLPFSSSKGEALIIEAPELTNEHVFKKGMLLVPLPSQGMFWVGSSYQWEYDDDRPGRKFYEQVTTLLKNWLKTPFRVVDHKAGIRPSTLERRPFIGLHPVQRNVGICNGMGTKGTSLGPFFGFQLAQHLVSGLPITREADVGRFTRILSK